MKHKDAGIILAVGDIAPDRPDPNECFDLIRDEFQSADFAFCQLETSLTRTGVRLPQARHAVRGNPSAPGPTSSAPVDP